MSYLCDTNIISELVKPQPNPGVLAWSSELTAMALSVITLEEITLGHGSVFNPFQWVSSVSLQFIRGKV